MKDFLADLPPLRYVVFACLAALVVLLAAYQTDWTPWQSTHNDQAIDFTQGLLALLYPVVALAPVVALRAPLTAAALAALPLPIGLVTENHWPWVVFLSMLASALVATWTSPRKAVVVAAAALLPPLTTAVGWSAMEVPYGAVIDDRGSSPLSMLALYVVVVAALFGAAMWQRSEVTKVRDRAALDRSRREVADDAAVVAERSRLARDLHDVVAHHVSLIAVRAETAPYTHPGLDEDARAVLADIATDARGALDELRGVLGILGRSTDDPARAPQPAWADIAALVERARASGAVVMLRGVAGDDVSAAAGYAGYRVVQEALTNARKHAPGRPVTVTLTASGALAVVRVTTPLRGDTPADGAGHGLAGMRERVEGLGGTLRAGPVGDEFVVEATLPQAVARVPA